MPNNFSNSASIQETYKDYVLASPAVQTCTIAQTPRIAGIKDGHFHFFFKSVVQGLKSTVLQQVENYIKSYQGNYSCYEDIGCFHPSNRTGLEIGGPVAPDLIGTRFLFFSNQSSTGIEINHTTWAQYYETSGVDITKQLIVVVHGFTQDTALLWMVTLKDALLKTANCNVLLVNWTGGAMFPAYAQAAANTPLPGVLLSLLLEEMMRSSNCSLMPYMMHVVGFSLGAHVAGFCGRHFENNTGLALGRISGLDPAGPLFQESNASLSSTDATFVDIIHTSAGNLSDSRFGINKSIGHVDFYPNGGSDQPGCQGK
ncbi:pancreatic lipase-related protein 2-like [Amblyomma americanum]